MDKKGQKKVERARKVKAKVQKRRAAKRQADSTEAAKERLMYQTRQRQTPVVNSGDSSLVRNNKVLQEMLAELEALKLFREENKDKAEEAFEKAKESQKEWEGFANGAS